MSLKPSRCLLCQDGSIHIRLQQYFVSLCTNLFGFYSWLAFISSKLNNDIPFQWKSGSFPKESRGFKIARLQPRCETSTPWLFSCKVLLRGLCLFIANCSWSCDLGSAQISWTRIKGNLIISQGSRSITLGPPTSWLYDKQQAYLQAVHGSTSANLSYSSLPFDFALCWWISPWATRNRNNCATGRFWRGFWVRTLVLMVQSSIEYSISVCLTLITKFFKIQA